MESEAEVSAVVENEESGNRSQQHRPLNRRSKLETCCDIISVIGSGSGKPTHIMYGANLSWTVLKEYIKELTSVDLVRPLDSEGRRLYKLTNRGSNLLETYKSIKSSLPPLFQES